MKTISMKPLYYCITFLMCISFGNTIAQDDYCKKIKKEVDEMKGITIYRTPELKHLKCYKAFIKNDENPPITLHISIYGQYADYNGKGVYIKFEDGTITSREFLSFDCHYVGSVFGEPPYLFQAFYKIDEDNIKNFSTKKIVKIQINNTSFDMTVKESEKTLLSIQCLDAIKIK